MPAVTQKQNPATIIPKGGFEALDAMNCVQAREKLDAIFDGNSPLEETRPAIKRILFGHLENCGACCRSFDVRVGFRSFGRSRIY